MDIQFDIALVQKKNGLIKRYFVDSMINRFLLKSIRYLNEGDIVNNFKSERMGVFILGFKNKKDSEIILDNITNLIKIEVE